MTEKSMTVITPTVGRVVWYIPDVVTHKPGDQPFAALVTYVHSDRGINLAVFDHDGNHFRHNSVLLLQEGDPGPTFGGYAQWMPYQLKMASKDEAA